MTLNPDLPVLVPGELITAEYHNNVRLNIDRLDRRRTRLYSIAGVAVSGAFGSIGGAVCTLPIPPQDFAGSLFIAGHLRLDRSVPGDDFRVQIRVGTGVLAEAPLVGGGAIRAVSPTTSVAIPAGAGRTVYLWVLRQAGGTGTGTTYADGTNNRLDVQFLPEAA